MKPRSLKLRDLEPHDIETARRVFFRAAHFTKFRTNPHHLGRAVAIMEREKRDVAHLPWLDHPSILGLDPARWRAFAAGYREARFRLPADVRQA